MTTPTGTLDNKHIERLRQLAIRYENGTITHEKYRLACIQWLCVATPNAMLYYANRIDKRN